MSRSRTRARQATLAPQGCYIVRKRENFSTKRIPLYRSGHNTRFAEMRPSIGLRLWGSSIK